jgi:hypothetical protein
MYKSKKMQWVKENCATLQHTKGNGRWLKVWRDIQSGIYHLNAGEEYLPADYTEEHATIEALEAAMREVADLRRWNVTEW